MAESLFTTQTPTGTNNSDGSPGITTATTLRFAVDGSVTGVRFFATTTVSGTYTVALYRVDRDDFPGSGTLLASKVAGGLPTGGAWNVVSFDSPVLVTAGTVYRTCVHSSAGRYVNTSGFFATALTNGNVTALADGSDPGLGTIKQGTFEINAALAYPDDAFGSSSYFVDVVFEPAGAGPPQGTAGVGLDLVVAASGRAAARGSAALELALAVDARSGRAVVSRPFTGTVTRPFTGLVVRP